MIRMILDLLLTPFFWLMGFGALMWLGQQLATLGRAASSNGGGLMRWPRTSWPVAALVAFYLAMVGIVLARPARATKEPGVVILCDQGGVYRGLAQADGTMATGSACVLHDQHGGHTSADAIVCYDNANAAP